MGTQLFLLTLYLILVPLCSSSTSNTLKEGFDLSVEQPENVLISLNGVFTAGFHSVGDNAYCFAIWFTKPTVTSDGNLSTVIWMANRDQPVNGKLSKLTLHKNGDLDLIDADQTVVWATKTVSLSSVQLYLHDSGNLLLLDKKNVVLWQSFDSPTDTLLPRQNFTRDSKLISSRSKTNISSGFYQLFFDNDNIMRLLYNGPDDSSLYWPNPWSVSWDVGRTTYDSSRIASLDPYGNFSSTDNLNFVPTDYGLVRQRRLTLDFDGDLRLYSRDEGNGGDWVVVWQAIAQPCKIHGACGPNSLCSYVHGVGRKCSCPPRFKVKNPTDWSYGCEPQFNLSCSDKNKNDYLKVRHVEFYGYDLAYVPNVTLSGCEARCSESCKCKGFQFKYDGGFFKCYTKMILLNGNTSPDFPGDFYFKIPSRKNNFNDKSVEELSSGCSGQVVRLERSFPKNNANRLLESILWFACALGGVEIIVIFLIWILTFKSPNDSISMNQGYLLAGTGFKRFTYSELKQATRNFSEEIGRGAGGTVYKGVLPDDRVVAIKRLYEANQQEGEFLAEVSIIGKLNHMHLIEMWGYCAEKNHKLLVYEFMEHGSLAQNLSTDKLDWEKRYEIAVGTAKGLAYLHEECLEWVLHCDVKPQNILLDSKHRPKVSDFGLSKLLNRSGLKNQDFSKIRGTRGYMAPEWIFNMPITSKVDVYSYGVVVLELVTGRSPTAELHGIEGCEDIENIRLVTWMREKINAAHGTKSLMEEIVDPMLEGKYDMAKMEVLTSVALQCLEEDRNERPTMSQVVEMLLRHEDEHRKKDHKSI